MEKHFIQPDLAGFPYEILPYFKNTEIYDSSSSERARVYYCDRGYFVKVAPKGALQKEANMSELFFELGLGVEVLEYLSADRDYLVTAAARGQDLLHYLHAPEKVCEVLADCLRELHSKAVNHVPLSAAYTHYMEAAAASPEDGYGHKWVLMDRYPIASTAEARSIMQEYKDQLKADTLIHGDACLPNVILQDWRFSAFIDFDQAGLGDRHIDLYWALWSLRYNLKTEGYADRFLDRYGRENFDPKLLHAVAAFEFFGHKHKKSD